MQPFLSKDTVVVDLDGTLVSTDTLHESILLAMRIAPSAGWRMLLWLMHGRSHFKHRVAQLAIPDASVLPYRESVIAYVRAKREAGHQVVLATAADRSIAMAVAAHLNLFDAIIASEPGINLKGEHKAKAIREHLGERSFSYIGDTVSDLPIWRDAGTAVVVSSGGSLLRQVRRMKGGAHVEVIRDDRRSWRDMARALRLYQWVKNFLIFVPLLTTLRFLDGDAVASATLAFVAFGLLASAGYVVNDLLDIESDRRHPRKSRRPFAAGRIGVMTGAAAACVLLTLGLVISTYLGLTFLAIAIAYLALTFGYSLLLKRYVFVDVITLSVLYTVRVLGGAAAIGDAPSVWLLGFSVFIFFGLALIKRVAELLVATESGIAVLKGRDYRTSDLPVLAAFGAAASGAAVVVYILFTSAVAHEGRFASPQLLWPGSLGLLYWQARMWVKTFRGEMTDDPIVFTVKDRGSRVVVALLIAIFLAAAFYRF